jgi:hypothetical protein
MPDKSEQFLTPAELSARFGNKIKESTLANWRSRGKGPPYTRIGGRILYRLDDVIAWERARTITRSVLKVLIPAVIWLSIGFYCGYLASRQCPRISIYPKPLPETATNRQIHLEKFRYFKG